MDTTRFRALFCILLSFFVLPLFPENAVLPSFSGFDTWKVSTSVSELGIHQNILDLRSPALSLRVQNTGEGPLKMGIELHHLPLGIGLSAGLLRAGGLLSILANPIISEAPSLWGNVLALPASSGKHVPAFLLSLPFLDTYLILSPNGHLRSLGGIVNIGQGHKILRIISHYELWHKPQLGAGSGSGAQSGAGSGAGAGVGSGSKELFDLFWMPGNFSLLNFAAVLDLPPALFTHSLNASTLKLYEAFTAIVALQLPLPIRTLSSEPYMVHPALWWFRVNYRSGGSVLLGHADSDSDVDVDAAAASASGNRGGSERGMQRILRWELAAEASYLSGNYIRIASDNNAIAEPGENIAFRGKLALSGLGEVYTSFRFRGNSDAGTDGDGDTDTSTRDTRIRAGAKLNSSIVNLGLGIDYTPQSDLLYSRIDLSTPGKFQAKFSTELLWQESGPHFSDATLGLALYPDNAQAEINLRIKNAAARDHLSNFFPSPFDTHIRFSLKIAFNARVGDMPTRANTPASASASEPAPASTFKIILEAASPREYPLSRILFEGVDEPFLEGWEWSLTLSLEG